MNSNYRFLTLCSLALAFLQPAQAAEEKNPLEDLSFLIGEWEGRATLHFPNNPEREKREETVSVKCQAFLNEAYILCQSNWSAQKGGKRELTTFFSYHPEEKVFYALYLYDNWPGIVRYPMALNENGSSILGFSDYQNPDGTKGFEKVQWAFSEDRKSITATEHVVSADDQGWALSFDFEWYKK